MTAKVNLCLVVVPYLLFPGGQRGVPNQVIYRNNQVMPADLSLAPDPEEVVQQLESHGGHRTLFSPFGQDPLKIEMT